MIYKYYHENGPDFCVDFSDLSFVQLNKETLLFVFKSKNESMKLFIKDEDRAWDIYNELTTAWKEYATYNRIYNK